MTYPPNTTYPLTTYPLTTYTNPLNTTYPLTTLSRRVYLAALHAAAAYSQPCLDYRGDGGGGGGGLALPAAASAAAGAGDGDGDGGGDGDGTPSAKGGGGGGGGRGGGGRGGGGGRKASLSFASSPHEGFDLLFDTDELEEGIRRDFEAAEQIEMDGSVTTTRSRTNFLLDMFECRMRFLCMCGWLQRGGCFEDAVETLVNGYFIVIVSKFARFLDDKVFGQFQGACV